MSWNASSFETKSSYNSVLVHLNAYRDGFTLTQANSPHSLDTIPGIEKNNTIEPSLKPHLIKVLQCKTAAAAPAVLTGLHSERFEPSVEYSCDLGGDGHDGVRITNVYNGFLKELVRGRLYALTKMREKKCTIL